MARIIAETPKKIWTKPQLKQIRAGAADSQAPNVTRDNPSQQS